MAASVREIIQATGVTRPVLYYYCSSKEDLFKRLVHWKHDQAYRELGEIVAKAKNCKESLRAIIRGSFAFCAADPRVPQVMFQTHFGPLIPGISEFLAEVAKLRFLLVHQVMENGLKTGELQGGDAASLSLLFCCIMDQHINVLARLPNARDRLTPALADGLLSMFLSGAGTEKHKRTLLPEFRV